MNIITTKKTSEKEDIKITELLKFNHALMWWWMANGCEKIFKMEDINLVNSFWELCESYGIHLTQEEKEDIFRDFLDD